MANRTFADYAADLATSTGLDSVIGLEGSTVKTGGAASATVETTGTITGTDPVLVPCFPIPDSAAYLVSGSVIFKCTDAGAGLVVVGECAIGSVYYILINSSALAFDDISVVAEDSMNLTAIEAADVNSGQMRISITPPGDGQSASDSEFSYKIRLSGFSL